MKITFNKAEILQYVLLLIILSVCFFSYIRGLESPFLFDDLPNMENIGKYAYLGNFNDFLLYILSGDSSPIGRPISLASFYISDNQWNGMSRFDFKYINLMIHIINGLLVYLIIYKVFSKFYYNNNLLKWLPLLTTTFWLLNPIHTNTILYAVQRMTELSAFFTLVSILSYLYFSECFQQKKNIYLLFLLTSFISFILGILSKETALLTPVFIFLLEKNILKNNNKIINQLLLLYFTLIFVFLIYFGWFSGSSRDFTNNERLLSESRIIIDYIKNIIFPSLYGESLLYDDFSKSRTIVEPISTLLSILTLSLLLSYALFKNKKSPIISLGIFWFLSGHLIESTTIQLELYFNHRNYIPSLGISLIISSFFIYLIQINKLKNFIFLFGFLYLSFFIVSLNTISNLWTKPEKMLMSWLIDHPTSSRTIEAMYSVLDNHEQNTVVENAKNTIDNLLTNQYNYRYLVFRKLKNKCNNNNLTSEEFKKEINDLNKKSISLPDGSMLAQFISTWLEKKCPNIENEQILSFLNALKNKASDDFLSIIYYWQAGIYAYNNDLNLTILNLEKSYILKKNLDNMLMQIGYLTSAKLYKEAETKLALLEPDFCNHWRSCMILKLRRQDVDNLKTAIQSAQQKANNNEQAVHHSASEERS